jgi:carbamoyl-phosphate synthase large subunit
MKSVGEAMAIGPARFRRACRRRCASLENGFTGLDEIAIEGLGQGDDKNAVPRRTRHAHARAPPQGRARRCGSVFSDQDIQASCKIDPWFLAEIRGLIEAEAEIRAKGLPAERQARCAASRPWAFPMRGPRQAHRHIRGDG